MRIFAAILACLVLAACTTTDTRLAFKDQAKPSPGARVLVLQPDVQLSLLTAGGVLEARADWSKAAQANLAKDVEAQLKGRAHQFRMVASDDLMTGRVGQLTRLHTALGRSILSFDYGGMPLPTKRKRFDWTLGAGAQAMAAEQQADYALFIRSEGTYASGGRVVTAIGLSLIGVHVPLGKQQVFASLVDLRSGQVVWFNVAVAGPNADMRQPEGSASLAKSLLKSIPL
jgi:hypothetical protein